MDLEQTYTMTVPQFAKVMGVSASHIYRLIETNELPVPYFKLGTAIRLRVEHVEKYLRGEPVDQPTEAA
jgi:excisionase family DNA binding protein